MSEPKVKIEQSTRAIGGLTLLIIMFWGEPDLRDAIIHWLMTRCG